MTAEKFESPNSSVGGWGSVKAVVTSMASEYVLLDASRVVLHQNKPNGFACVSCAWAKPSEPHVVEACENGIKATAWELTTKRITPEFFSRHTVSELEKWSDLALEEQGRLTEPMRWDYASDKYVAVPWDVAFEDIGSRLKAMNARKVVFYTSGRASLEAAYMYQLMARMYGSSNLPDSANMCHESTSVALPKTIGVPVGTVTLDDFDHTDCIFFFGQNVGTNSPRMLHSLKDARKRHVPIVTFNPLRESGLIGFTDPLSPLEMLTGSETRISTQYHQVNNGGDLAALTGICKALIAADDEAVFSGRPRMLDVDFIETHTHGFDEFSQFVRNASWDAIQKESGLPKSALELAASEYAGAKAVIAVYGMGLTQHQRGVENVQMLSNLLLMRGNIGKRGAGICPVRGHSNVQGQRTVGITEKPELVPLDKLRELYAFEPPQYTGLNTVEVCEALLNVDISAFIGLGGNFVRAVPETELIEKAWRKLPLTVQIATKLNRSHVVHGKVSYLLPCIGRIEIDRQKTGEQAVTMEDSTGFMHGSRGVSEPAAATLRSEPAIIAGIAKATLAPGTVDWDAWVGNYSTIRDAIEATYPNTFGNFNARMWIPGGFRRPLPACDRKWNTDTGKANFIAPLERAESPDFECDEDVLQLMTLRSDDQFNTTVYSLNDRLRGVQGTRMLLFMHVLDIARLGFREGLLVTAQTASTDGIVRAVHGLRVTPYDVPAGCVAGYFPECNPLIPLWHHAAGSKVPAAKAIPIRLRHAPLT